MSRRVTLALVVAALVALTAAVPGRGPEGALGAGPIDISGNWVFNLQGNVTGTCDAIVTQTGSSVTLTGSCSTTVGTFSGSLSGTIDVSSGAVSVSGTLDGQSLSFVGTAAKDGNSASGTWTASPFPASGPFTGAKVTVSINDATVTEGQSGTTKAVLKITLSSAGGAAVTVDFATKDGTATAGSDYASNSGTLTFNPGETTKPVTVAVNGDTEIEQDETFFVNLSAPTNAAIGDGQGQGTILRDELKIAELPWSVYASGGEGASSESTNYRLGATAGQTAIGTSSSTNYAVGAGFWYGTIEVAPNTATGTNVVVSAGEGVTMTFDNVTGAGFTTTTTTGTGPPPPEGFRLGSPPVYYNISTTAQFTGSVKVCIDYDDSSFTPSVEARLRLMHRENDAWVDVTNDKSPAPNPDTVNNRICGVVSSFSVFLPVELIPEEDFDLDRCTNAVELEPKSMATNGGGRNPLNFWDLFDTETENGLNAGTHLAGAVSIGDIVNVVNHFAQVGSPAIDPLSDAKNNAVYHTRFDRTLPGPNAWNTGVPNGSVTIEDILNAVKQFAHNCL